MELIIFVENEYNAKTVRQIQRGNTKMEAISDYADQLGQL